MATDAVKCSSMFSPIGMRWPHCALEGECLAMCKAAQNSALGAHPCSWFGRYVTWCVSLWRGLAGRCGLDHLGSEPMNRHSSNTHGVIAQVPLAWYTWFMLIRNAFRTSKAKGSYFYDDTQTSVLRFFPILLLLVSCTGGSTTTSDCEPETYSFDESFPGGVLTSDSSGVIICPNDDYQDRTCPNGGDLLRQNVSTGEVVVLNPTCYQGGWPTTADLIDTGLTRCYVDECVPTGVYRYGYSVPFECNTSGCATYYFSQITIENDAGTDCKRVHGVPAPTPFQGQVPWKDEAIRCSVNSSESGCTVAVGPRRNVGWLVGGVTLGLALVFWWPRRPSRKS